MTSNFSTQSEIGDPGSSGIQPEQWIEKDFGFIGGGLTAKPERGDGVPAVIEGYGGLTRGGSILIGRPIGYHLLFGGGGGTGPFYKGWAGGTDQIGVVDTP